MTPFFGTLVFALITMLIWILFHHILLNHFSFENRLKQRPSLCSVLVPGLGQIYQGNLRWGLYLNYVLLIGTFHTSPLLILISSLMLLPNIESIDMTFLAFSGEQLLYLSSFWLWGAIYLLNIMEAGTNNCRNRICGFLSAGFSLFIPGFGQAYMEKFNAAMGFLIASLVLNALYADDAESGAFFSFIVVLLGVISCIHTVITVQKSS